MESIAGLPIVGCYLNGLKVQGELAFEHVRHYRADRVVVSGKTAFESLEQFCQVRRLCFLRQMGHAHDLSRKLWRARREDFAVAFTASDCLAWGTLRGPAAVDLRLYYRHADGRFLAILVRPR